MSVGITFWFILALAQGMGAVGQGFGSEEACQIYRDELRENEDVLKLSECLKVTLYSPEKKAE